MKQDKATFNHRNVVNLYFVYELNTWSRNLNIDVTLGDYRFGASKLIKNADPDKYGYIGYGTGFDARSQSSLPIRECGKNPVIFGVDDKSPRHTVNRKKDILFLGEEPMDGLDDITIMVEAKFSVIIIKLRKKIYLSVHCNAANIFLYANGIEIYQFKAKDSEKNHIYCAWKIF